VPAIILATAGGAGYAPVAPGTAGALVGVALFVLWHATGASPVLYAAGTLAVTALGVWACGAAERAFGRPDDGRIVIDEVAGQLWALAPLAAGLRGPSFWLAVVTAFVLFRVLDIAKPGPVGWAERGVGGGLGVMADDVVAGGLAALVWILLGSLLAALGGDPGLAALGGELEPAAAGAPAGWPA